MSIGPCHILGRMATRPGYNCFADLAPGKGQISGDSILSLTLYGGGQVKVIPFRFAAAEESSERKPSAPALLHFLERNTRLTLASASRRQARDPEHVYARVAAQRHGQDGRRGTSATTQDRANGDWWKEWPLR